MRLVLSRESLVVSGRLLAIGYRLFTICYLLSAIEQVGFCNPNQNTAKSKTYLDNFYLALMTSDRNSLPINTSYIIHHTSLNAHAFHTSITRMDYNAKEKSFELSIRVFTDDLEKALSAENGGKKISVVNNDKNDGIVESYIRKCFSILNPQKQKRAFSYIGKEQEADATWIYIEFPCKDGVGGLSIQNTILHDFFNDQINLVNINYLATKKSFIFKKSENIHALEL